jgi:AraC-like DNA-binding protein
MQFHKLLTNIEKLYNTEDSGFLFGERLLQSAFNPVDVLLGNAETTLQALRLLVKFSLIISPLWKPGLYEDSDYIYLYWQNSFCWRKNDRLLMEAACGLVARLYYRIIGQKPRWKVYFNYSEPARPDHYTERFGDDACFSAPLNVMRLERLQLLGINNSKQTAAIVTEQYYQQLLDGMPAKHALLERIYGVLLQEVYQQPGLESIATNFSMSQATLKRKLKVHHCHYQQLVDSRRSHVALCLMICKGYSNERVAEQLKFHDVRNFRRSFKHWTGVLPSKFREQFP